MTCDERATKITAPRPSKIGKPISRWAPRLVAKRILAVVLALFVAVSLVVLIAQEARAPQSDSSVPGVGPGHRVRVYYFHGTERCPSCEKIEKYTGEALQAAFAAELKDGRLSWRVLDRETPANEHFVKEYKLVTQTVILAEFHDGKQTAWKDLDQVWDLLGNEAEFKRYIQTETRAFLEKPR